jgi:DNA-binding response OmpR family regulator
MSESIKLRVLVVEDDPRMLDLLTKGFREIGHTVMPASDGQAGLQLAVDFAFDVIVLDIGLPHRDGFELTRTLRAARNTVAILMLTARDTEDDIIQGLELGADDYLTKPFSFRELVARVHRLGRTAHRPAVEPAIVLDPARLVALRDDTHIQLTRTEFLLLSTLSSRPGAPVSRKALSEAIWGAQQAVGPNTLDVLVNGLRNKLDVPYKRKLLHTVRGVGYCLRLHDDSQELAS